VAEVAEGGAEKDPVVIGMTIDPRQPTRELFRGKVILFDKKLDLALAQITCGLYRQPLPKGYRFPTIPLGDSAAMEIGDTVSTLGFPLVGGSIGRVSVTLTRGVVSGYERAPIGTLIKTDAGIGPGNSGGAALDSQWRLIGVPTYENVNPDAVSRMSYLHPIALMPEAWRAMLPPPENSSQPVKK
jgi:S1-C subfamily serine protease